AYLVVDYHLQANRDPFVYRTADFGRSWKKISDGLPKGHALAYALSLAENPNRKGMLVVGTGQALYVSLDDGQSWKPLKDGLPTAPVTWVTVQKQHHDVVVSTYGRGLYVLSDVTPLEQADQVEETATAHLYAPRSGFRFARNGRAEIDYWLKAPADAVQIDVLDPAGTVVRTMKDRARAGLTRTSWDLR